MQKRIIIVSNRLPVTVELTADQIRLSPSAGGVATGLSSVYRQGNNLWVGWPGLANENIPNQQSIINDLQKDHMAPVFLTKGEVHDFYEGFSNSTLWPLYHYFTEFAEYNEELWEAYKQVNEKYCEIIAQVAGPDDVIWVQDYQLLLLPEMLRERLPQATIGFFQHIPFPSYEIFRLLPWRYEILMGMMGADLIGFHTYDDMRHFLSSVKRICGLSHTMGIIRVGAQLTKIDAFPMGIDFDKFANAPTAEATRPHLKELEDNYADQKLILSIDRLDYSKGINKRLQAFEEFLNKYPEWQGKVSLLMIVVPSRTKVEQYQHLKEEIDKRVGAFEGKFSRLDWKPVYYFYRSFSFEELSALYTRADVAMITPLRDGMNLVCKEYVASKSASKRGVLILSEMAGAAKELSEALLINPNDLHGTVHAINQALTMPEEEQEKRMIDLQETVKRYNVHQWVETFLDQLYAIKEKQLELNTSLINDELKARIAKRFEEADSRLLLLDYDGTLQGFFKDPQAARPDDELLMLLTKLSNDPKNTVVVISGRDHETLQEWVGELPLDMIAEHGIWTKGEGEQWGTIETLTKDWKAQVRSMLERYVDRTPGSFIEDKAYSLVWHYRNADAEFGELRSRELVSTLSYLLANMNLQVMEGNKVIEIKNRDVNKGKTARTWMARGKYDFVLAIGDDVTDEDTFEAMPSGAYTIKVGAGNTVADYSIRSYKEVRKLLQKLADSSQNG